MSSKNCTLNNSSRLAKCQVESFCQKAVGQSRGNGATADGRGRHGERFRAGLHRLEMRGRATLLAASSGRQPWQAPFSGTMDCATAGRPLCRRLVRTSRILAGPSGRFSREWLASTGVLRYMYLVVFWENGVILTAAAGGGKSAPSRLVELPLQRILCECIYC